MTTDEKKLEILRKVENGSLSIEEGSDQIAMVDQEETNQTQPEIVDPVSSKTPTEKHETSGCWKAAWSMILAGGAVLTAFSAYWVYQGYANHGFSWGFWLSWIPLLIGVALMIVGWALMESPWMHVKVHAKDESKTGTYVFSMPVPFNIARWVMQNFGQYMPENVKRDEVLEILDQAEIAIKNGEPFSVNVDDDHDGSKVDIFIN